jgi:hypothetical protein
LSDGSRLATWTTHDPAWKHTPPASVPLWNFDSYVCLRSMVSILPSKCGSRKPRADLLISIADLAVPERRLAIYVDGAAFHAGSNLRRDRFIRNRLRNGNPPWRVVELRAADLARGRALVDELGV